MEQMGNLISGCGVSIYHPLEACSSSAVGEFLSFAQTNVGSPSCFGTCFPCQFGYGSKLNHRNRTTGVVLSIWQGKPFGGYLIFDSSHLSRSGMRLVSAFGSFGAWIVSFSKVEAREGLSMISWIWLDRVCVGCFLEVHLLK